MIEPRLALEDVIALATDKSRYFRQKNCKALLILSGLFKTQNQLVTKECKSQVHICQPAVWWTSYHSQLWIYLIWNIYNCICATYNRKWTKCRRFTSSVPPSWLTQTFVTQQFYICLLILTFPCIKNKVVFISLLHSSSVTQAYCRELDKPLEHELPLASILSAI